MIFNISWGAPEHVWILSLLGIAIGLLLYRYKKKCIAIQALSGSFASDLIRHFSRWRSVVKIIFMSIALLFLLLTTLQPQGKKEKDSVAQEARDLFIALDVSRSMLAADVSPNRLLCARQKIKNLLKQLSCERVGLLLFSGSAFIQCPLTQDYAAFYMFLEHVDAESISSGTTAIDKAILKTLETFENVASKKNKLLVIITDGEDFSTQLASVKHKAMKQDLHIFTLGIGSTQGAPIPLYDDHGTMIGHQKDAHGNIVISRLNEDMLHNLSRDIGGKYVRVTQDNSDIRSLVSQVQKFEKERLENKTFDRMQQYYPYFLLVSFIFLIGEWLV